MALLLDSAHAQTQTWDRGGDGGKCQEALPSYGKALSPTALGSSSVKLMTLLTSHGLRTRTTHKGMLGVAVGSEWYLNSLPTLSMAPSLSCF